MLIRKILQRVLPLLLAVAFLTPAMAQNRTVTGKVTDLDGRAIPAATVKQVDGSATTLTDENGTFTISVPLNARLEVSFVGYTTQSVNTGSESSVEVFMAPGTAELGEVVVTALGIKRERRQLGYAVQEVKGEDLVQAREPNVANALTGKVAGLNVIRSSTGPAGSSKIILRGFNSLTGNNQPLIIVDGVPMENFAGAANNDFWNPSLDMGNGLADINSEDIASLTVLKGGAAAALYGSRAGNGVIMITTKTGRKTPGLGITLSSSFGIERPFLTPEIQTQFGQGSNAAYDRESTSSWGPLISGQQVQAWDGSTRSLQYYDNYNNYFTDPGFTSNQNLSFQQQFGGTSVYASYNRIDDQSFIPNVKLIRNNLTARQVTKFGNDNKWEIDTKIQYGRNDAHNRPAGGVATASNQIYGIISLPNTVDIRDFSDPWNELGGMKWYLPSTNSGNPYWTRDYNLNNDVRDRYMMTGAIKHHLTDWMTVELKAGTDRYSTNATSRTYFGGPLVHQYSESKQSFFEDNYTAMLNGRKDDLGGSRWGMNYTLGGNIMKTRWSSLSSNSGPMEVPNLFSLNNSVDRPTVGQGFSEKQINSVFGSVGFNYDGYWFVDVTGRNDWSSALSAANRSFFYPSVSTSLVITDMMRNMGAGIPAFLSYAKIRGSFAEVGNDMSPYRLLNAFFIGNNALGSTTAWRNSVLFSPDIRNELIRNYEAGLEMRFLRNRIGFEFTWYQSNATNQIINLPMDPQSGYSSRVINAGNIQNRGVELVIDGTVVQAENDGFRWDTRINGSRNRNVIVELHEDVTSYPLGGFDNVQLRANVGGNYGQITGTRALRVTDERSPYFGQMILDANGLPLYEQNQLLGDQQANFLLGWTNNFSYKGFFLTTQIDGRFGGQIFSGTNRMLQAIGKAAVTAPGGERPDLVVPGVIRDEDGNLEPNTVSVSQQEYWNHITTASGNLGISEFNLYDASHLRIRQIAIGYNIPSNWVDGTFIQRARASLSMNNVYMIRHHLNGVDPESVFATGTNAVGFENMSPPTMRNIMLNLTIGF